MLTNAHARKKDFKPTFQDEGVREVSFEVISVDLDLFYTPGMSESVYSPLSTVTL